MTGEVDLKKLIEVIIPGGWPGSLGLPLEQAALLPVQYLDVVIDHNVHRVDGAKRDPQKMRLLLRSLACALLKAPPPPGWVSFAGWLMLPASGRTGYVWCP